MQVNILQGMNILDAALASGGSLEDVFAFASLNGLALTDDLPAGAQYQGTGKSYPLPAIPQVNAPVNDTVQVLAGQTLADIAIQQLGSLQGLFGLALLNGLSITDDAPATMNYNLTPVDKEMVAFFKQYGFLPASGGVQPSYPQGIGYWTIEQDFKVS